MGTKPATRLVSRYRADPTAKTADLDRVFVFAYGSNLFLPRIRDRAPSVEAVGIGFVPQYRFQFHKRSQDGSAKADAFHTGDARDRIYGALYALTRGDKACLDRHEFLGIGYDERYVEVVGVEASWRAWIYTARAEARDPSLLPYEWYWEYVIRGASLHRLPRCYIERIRCHKVCRDPDQLRHASNIRLCESDT